MPIVACSMCGTRQIVRAELLNLLVMCRQCSREFRAVESRTIPAEVSPPEPLTLRGLLRGIALIVGLVLPLVLLVGLVIWATRERPPEPASPTPPPRPVTPAVPLAPPRPAPIISRELADDLLTSFRTVRLNLIGWAIVGVMALYLLVILAVGAWIGRNALARGHSPLGWMSFYFVMQALLRIVAFPLGVMGSIFAPSSIPLLIAFAEMVAWSGLITYLLVRTRGTLERCDRCQEGKLITLRSCPRCGSDAVTELMRAEPRKPGVK